MRVVIIVLKSKTCIKKLSSINHMKKISLLVALVVTKVIIQIRSVLNKNPDTKSIIMVRDKRI